MKNTQITEIADYHINNSTYEVTRIFDKKRKLADIIQETITTEKKAIQN